MGLACPAAMTRPPRRDCVRLLLFSGSAGHWRAQVAVNHPRKLWGFKSLPAHHSDSLRPMTVPECERYLLTVGWEERWPLFRSVTSSMTWMRRSRSTVNTLASAKRYIRLQVSRCSHAATYAWC